VAVTILQQDQIIKYIFEEGELSPEVTVKNFLTVRREEDREVRQEVDYFFIHAWTFHQQPSLFLFRIGSLTNTFL
jgi:hypothetical protein